MKARIKGLLITIGAAVLIVLNIVFSALVSGKKNIRNLSDAMELLLLLLLLFILWFFYGIFLLIFGKKMEIKNKKTEKEQNGIIKNDSGDTQNEQKIAENKDPFESQNKKENK